MWVCGRPGEWKVFSLKFALFFLSKNDNSLDTQRDIEIQDRGVTNVIDEWFDKKREIERGRRVRWVLEINGCLKTMVVFLSTMSGASDNARKAV